ncbi:MULTISPECIES: DUF2613 domain-containing protein [Corynebacterium]|uniref:DUF2613 domain-containing protein n=3 Tax=Corynebacterium TaxID=1716 RepID=A0A3G6IY31_9CORY|nr:MULTISPECIES: DUF2613 domain-containing protein [Corynebacterium]AZA08349.1 hypothetical protein CPPEL_01005 [Corynebacterium pseudopelargi]AZA10556.1 hypothetical protein CGERO_01105 [Corynebacterium gerontici]QAU51515.1 hypothetical protein CPELA_01070 [Corynebacterium pelargi]GGG79706.1 hypothetical protein GCM10007338_17570 [Corynebacterium pelargi]
MAFDSDSLNARTLGPTIASAIVGVAIGVAAIFGISMINDSSQSNAVDADQALLGDPEYGSREGGSR